MHCCSPSTMLSVASLTLISACTIDQPAASDLVGPRIEVTASGGATFVIEADTRRITAADNCANIMDVAGGSVNNRSVDLTVVMVDKSGMRSSRITVEGDGIRSGSVDVSPASNPVVSLSDGRDIDEITLTYLRTAEGVLNASITKFTIDSPFTPGVTLSASGVDTFGNETTFADFELLSELAICNY